MRKLAALLAATPVVISPEARANGGLAPERLTEVRMASGSAANADVPLDALDWFVGDWHGEVFGLNVNHVVFTEVGGQLPGLVRLYNDEGIVLYELSSFFVEGGKLVYRNRLFDAGLNVSPSPTGDIMTRAVVGQGDDIVFFDGITFAKNGDNCAVVSFALPRDDREPQKHSVFFTQR